MPQRKIKIPSASSHSSSKLPSSPFKRRVRKNRIAHRPPIRTYPSANAVFNVPMLLSMIAYYLDWYTLMALSRSSRAGRIAARFRTRQLLRTLLRPYLRTSTLDDFLYMLDKVRGAVVGSIIRRLLAANSEAGGAGKSSIFHTRYNSSADLNILVETTGYDSCVKFFRDLGYPEFQTMTPAFPYERSVAAFAKTVIRREDGRPVSSLFNQ